MSLLCRFLFGLCLFFVEQNSFCPDEGHFVVLVQRFGPHKEVRVRIDMPNSSKVDVVDVLKHYFSYSREADHPFIQAMKMAGMERLRERLCNDARETIIEKEGTVRTSNDKAVPFRVSYGFNSEVEASAQGVGKQILTSDVKQF